MFKWLTGDIQAVVTNVENVSQDVTSLRGLVTELVTDLAAAKVQLEAFQAIVTKLSNGALTAATEIGILRAALLQANIVLPPTPWGEVPKQDLALGANAPITK